MNYKSLYLLLIMFSMTAVSAQELDKATAISLGLIPSLSETAIKEVGIAIGRPTEIVLPESGQLQIKRSMKEATQIVKTKRRIIITGEKPLKPNGEVGIVTMGSSGQQIVFRFINADETNYDKLVSVQGYKVPVARERETRITPKPGNPLQKENHIDGMVELTAFGARTIYAPERVHRLPKGVQNIAVNPKLSPDLLHLVRDRRIQAKLISTWRRGGHYLSIVKLYSDSGVPISLTPEKIRGRFIGKSFHDNALGGAGNGHETTAYLISDTPLMVIMGEL